MAAPMVTGETTVSITVAITVPRVTKSAENVYPVIRAFTAVSVISRAPETVTAHATNGRVSVTNVSRDTSGCNATEFVRSAADDVHDTVENAHTAWTDTGACFVT